MDQIPGESKNLSSTEISSVGIGKRENSDLIGYVVGGGLKENFLIRLILPADKVQEGAFVVIKSGDWIFYGLVTDLRLGATDPRFADEQSGFRLGSQISGMLYGQTLFTNLEVLPVLMLNRGPDPGTAEYNEWIKAIESGKEQTSRHLPVKTVPAHHSPVHLAGEGDIAEIFGKREIDGNFVVGYTREQGYAVCINLDKFVQRSAGIFGATGTGKSFLTRILLGGMIQYDRASVLVFDMHNEYAYDDTASDTRQRVIGLQSKFRAKLRVVGLGSGAQIRGMAPDFNLEFAESDIQPEDIELLTRELDLRETTPTTLDALIKSFGRENWFGSFRRMNRNNPVEAPDGSKASAPGSVAEWANSEGVNQMAAEGLHSKLRRVFNRAYIVEKPAADTISKIVQSLESGKHIVLSFGEFESDLDYLLVCNLLTRRIRKTWEEKTNDFRSRGESEPRPLVIVLEEAHKLLNREMASQTTFSMIAREMRKYYVTLLIIDQRPSQIYDEVMSQLGTRISGWLGDDDDIRAVLSGLAGREAIRGMLSRLQPKEEVLLLGWGVPMPLPVRSRRYDELYWEEVLGNKNQTTGAGRQEKILHDLGF